MPQGSGMIIMAKDPTGKYKDCRMDAEGNLKCELTSSIDVAIGDVEMKGTANADGSGAKRHVVVDATGHQTVNILGNEEPDGSGAARHLHLDGNGNLSTTVVNTLNVTPADSANSEVTDDPSKSMCVTLKGRTAINDKTAGKHIKITPNGRLEPVLHARTDIADAATETAVLCNNAGRLQVDVPATTGVKLEDLSSTIDADHVNNSRSLPTTMKARSNISDHTTGKYLLCDADGHLQVDVVSMSGGGDATAANQSTMITHLSEIEGAVETLEGCVSAGKIAVELDAGDLNIGNVDVVSASGITQLPSTLGQKANANCLATCRSSTVGAYDLSARTTIGTSSTSTKLACSAAGSLMVKTAINTSNGGPTNTATIASGALGHTEGLSADNTFANVYLMIDTADSGVLQDTYVMVARTNTATSDYFVHTRVGAGGGSVPVEWENLPGTTRYYAHVHISKPPEFIGVYNGGPSANKIAVLFNYGLE